MHFHGYRVLRKEVGSVYCVYALLVSEDFFFLFTIVHYHREERRESVVCYFLCSSFFFFSVLKFFLLALYKAVIMFVSFEGRKLSFYVYIIAINKVKMQIS